MASGHRYWPTIGKGLMFPKSIRRDVVILICIKAAVLTLIYYAFVAPVTLPEPDGHAMTAYLLHGSRN